MLNADTKRHIDAARDVLVGVAPNPMTQIDQITYALIYKFMDDMDEAAIKAGGDRSFFTGDLAPYAWSNLVDTRIGSQEKMDLFAEALTKFAEAPQLPELFRTIFRAAFLPYRSPETLGLFIKEINYFDYSHPEELGNAYEYLLSIMSSQGDAGQFRTPRHIIDFMVDVLDPTKDDTILDPACGTGGFLVSSYNHILEKHDGKEDPNGTEKPLTPAERKKLTQNLAGYDIDPSMVRFAQVNMYLHQFKNPQIFQYDGLTRDERWHDKFDVILANPPFMTPKGGIKPHNKFGIKSNRAEVLFIDYIASHLKPNGRAAIVVPDGIVSRIESAYKVLRRGLIDGGLVAVVSLPAGVFKPYSGVKTSILFLDKRISVSRDSILFVDVANDGFSLGDTRRPIDANDLPEALATIAEWLTKGNTPGKNATEVKKAKLLDGPNVPLNNPVKPGANYKESSNKFLALSELISTVTPPKKIPSSSIKPSGKFPVIDQSLSEISGFTDDFSSVIFTDTPVVVFGDHTCAIKYVDFPFAQGADGIKILLFKEEVIPRFAYHVLHARPLESSGYQRHFSLLKDYRFPVPPIEVQEQIVVELDGYAAIISGAKKIVESWRPTFDINPQWNLVSLADVCEINPKKSEIKGLSPDAPVSFVPMADVNENNIHFSPTKMKPFSEVSGSYTYFAENDVLLAKVTPCFENGKLGIARNLQNGIGFGSSEFIVLRAGPDLATEILASYLMNSTFKKNGKLRMTGTGGLQRIPVDYVKDYLIPLPPLDDQASIVAKIEKESQFIDSARELIKTYEAKTQAVIAKLWSE